MHNVYSLYFHSPLTVVIYRVSVTMCEVRYSNYDRLAYTSPRHVWSVGLSRSSRKNKCTVNVLLFKSVRRIVLERCLNSSRRLIVLA